MKRVAVLPPAAYGIKGCEGDFRCELMTWKKPVSSQLRRGTPSFSLPPPTPKSTALGSSWDLVGSPLLQSTDTHRAGASRRDETPAGWKMLCRVAGALVPLDLLKSLSEGPELTPTPQISPLRSQVLPHMLRIW